ncbi:MAG: serine kinase [Dyadobacter sp. 50-39]|uniref:serine kinase n=1 Tax=Dyadobacter sp. 50-39 TaxID=1895756 RepID=UPI00095A1C21|nr:serine kinase [Dyadobacter sp. 50-39]OJV16578.1 MAG: serine kinase [Dyadobacter sp. 50-39]
MHHYTAFGLHIRSEIPLPELSEGDPHAASDIYIRQGDVKLPDMRPTTIYRRGTRAFFGQDEQQAMYLQWTGVALFRASGGNELVVAPVTSDSNIISLFTVSEALGLILFQKGYFLLHASSVAIGEEAWCFMGMPGAGKSSTAAAYIKAGCRLLSDDLTAITFDESGNPFVIPAYPQLKIWEKTVQGLHYDQSSLEPVSEGINKFAYQPRDRFSKSMVPLRKVFFLHKARNKPAARHMNAAEVPGEMLRNFPLPTALLTTENLKRHFFQSLQCARFADLLRIRRPEGFDKLEKWVEANIRETLITE